MADINGSDDLHAELTAAMETSLQATPDDVPPPVEPVEAPPDPADAAPASADQRARDEQGRFAAKQAADAQAEGKPPEAKTADTPEQPAPTEKPSGPPPGWSPSSKAAWNAGKIPPEVIRDVAKRESEMAQGLSRLQQYKGLDRYVDLAKQSNTTLPEALDRYIAAEDQLNRNPEQGILWLAQSYGVDIGQLAAKMGGQQQQMPAPQQHYQAPDLSQVLNPLQQEVANLRAIVHGDKQSQVQSTVEKFFADPKYPYADNVGNEMAEIIAAGRARGMDISLEQAYDKACRLNDDVWNQIQSDRETQRQAEQARVAKERAGQAKRAAGSINGGPSTTPPVTGASQDNLRETLAAAFAGSGRA